MTKHALTLGLLLIVSSAPAQPALEVMSQVDQGSSVLFTIGINWNDTSTAAGFFQLEATATTGTIQQTRAFGAIDVNLAGDAATFEATPGSNYDKEMDSWWYAGPGQPFARGTPPFGGVQNGAPGQSPYRASFGTDPSTPVSGVTQILNLVITKSGGVAAGNLVGSIARLGQDFPFDFNFSAGTPTVGTLLSLNTDTLDFGPTRIGTTASLTLTATNAGDTPGLSGSFGAVSGAFGPPGSAPFGPLAISETASRDYTYSPTARGGDSESVVVMSNSTSGEPNPTVTLLGVGVGPVYSASSLPGSTLEVDISLTSTQTADITISNTTPDDDGGNAALTDLTIVDAELGGADAGEFSLTNLSDGDVLGQGDSRAAQITFGPSRNYRPRIATLTLHTDEGAPLGGDGADYTYQLLAAPRAPGIWQSLAGGAWESSGNWSLATVPASGDVVRFSLEGDYTVSLAANRSQGGLIVTNDVVRLDLGGHTLALTGNLLVGDLPTSDGRLVIADGAVSAGGVFVGGSEAQAGGAGTVVVEDANLVTSAAIKVWPGGTLELDQGSVAAQGAIELAGGKLAGSGSVAATVFNSGEVAPDGPLEIAGNYAQSPSGTLSIDLESQATFDILSTDGLALLFGALDVRFAGGFVPEYGDAFAVLTFGARSGMFSSITTDEFLPGRMLLSIYSATSLTLYAVAQGDANGDGYVTPADYTIWADHFGLGPGATILEGDFNLDGFVDGADYTIWADQYTGLPDGPMAVPEPATWILVLQGLALLALTKVRAAGTESRKV